MNVYAFSCPGCLGTWEVPGGPSRLMCRDRYETIACLGCQALQSVRVVDRFPPPDVVPRTPVCKLEPRCDTVIMRGELLVTMD